MRCECTGYMIANCDVIGVGGKNVLEVSMCGKYVW
jgi:hypothetical protein